ncbi:uncharacterized protein LOC110270530 [Arachis ipaensis]|uniref:GRF-type domain-containing protein n=1 Tax=Arachis hypogaea TaxID=3818 RepID=A0A444ZE14_ARAHY|nr:uncharacterized protein LOC110270530 [Arachis ipaensis]QHO06512.1 uncharacterized protein DS421_14g455310 [Arachis hypogaea]RYR12420.1 hypothetical protein Ahy_B04g069965 [Arachis hypogaea]
MSNSRDRGIGGDASDDEGRSIYVSSVGSAGARMKKRFVAPKCNCGIHAILFMSSTKSNPKRLFFGCPNFKIAQGGCKYFQWLDEYVSLFEEEQINNGSPYARNRKPKNFLDTDFWMEEKVTRLEDRVSGIELQMKNSSQDKCNRWFSYPLIVIVFVFGVVCANYLV